MAATETPELSPKILLRQGARQIEGMKASFEVARRLRERGYTVEMDTSAGSRGDYRLIVSMGKEDEEPLTLVDQATGKKQRRLSIDQVLQRLGEAK